MRVVVELRVSVLRLATLPWNQCSHLKVSMGAWIWVSLCPRVIVDLFGSFRRLGGVLIRGILPFRVLYSGPLFSEPPISTSAISSQLVSSRAEASQPQEAQILQRERQLRPRCRRGCECADGTAGARRRRLGVKAEVCLKLCS